MTDIDMLAQRWNAAKEKENQGRDERLAAESEMLKHAAQKPEGTVHVEGAAYRVTVGYGMTRSIDEPALAAVRERMGDDMFHRVFHYKPAIALPELRYLQSNEPQLYVIAAQAITCKPSKPSVRVEFVGAERRAA